MRDANPSTMHLAPPVRVRTRRSIWPVVALAFAVACVDTLISVEVLLAGGTVDVAGDGALEADLEVDLRVGRYAVSGDDVRLARLTLRVDEALVAEVPLDRPEGFDGRIEPGERVRARVRGRVMIRADRRATLCAQSEVDAALTWRADEQPDDPFDPPLMRFGAAEGRVRVRCD